MKKGLLKEYSFDHFPIDNVLTEKKCHILHHYVEEYMFFKQYSTRLNSCVGRELSNIFQVETVCDENTCTYEQCHNMKLPMGYSGQRPFWMRTPLCKYIFDKANWKDILLHRLCLKPRCNHLLSQKWQMFCSGHVCVCDFMFCKSGNPWLVKITGLLLKKLPKDVVRFHLFPFLKNRVLVNQRKAHFLNAGEFKPNGHLFGTCCKACCPSLRVTCAKKTSPWCHVRICCDCRKNQMVDGRFACKECR